MENENQMTVGMNNNPATNQKGMTAVESNRAMSQFQTSMMMAKMSPRRYTEYSARIKDACQRPKLAEAALYAYPRGGTMVTGPSIRLAEALAQAYGNLDFGIVEVEQRDGESVVMAYCHDLESNTRQQKVFTVKHERHSKKGVEKLKDPRDIYELAANYGARRLRACILGVIPGDVTEDAVEQCEKTMAGDKSEPLSDKIKKLTLAFAEFGVTVEHLEKRLGHKIEATIETEIVTLRKIFRSLKDGMADRADFFEGFKKETQAADTSLTDKLADTTKKDLKLKDAPPKSAEKPVPNEATR